MTYTLILDEITDRERIELARFEGNRVEVGREPGPGGVKLPHGAVSRIHGVFYRFRYTWFFVDNGSTNGSWLNGDRVFQGQYRIVRPGSVIQMAERAFQLSTYNMSGKKVQHLHWMEIPEETEGRSVFLFKNKEFQQEFDIPLFGRSVAIGGDDADIVLDDYQGLRPALVVERRGEESCIYSIAKRDEFSVNGRSHIELVNVFDNDIVTFREYTLIVNDPASSKDPVPAAEDTYDSASDVMDAVGLRGWSDEEETAASEPTSSMFQEPAPMVEQTQFTGQRSGFFEEPSVRDESPFERTDSWGGQADPKKSGFFGGVPEDVRDDSGVYIPSERSTMFATINAPQQKSFFEKLEEKIIVIVGVFMLLLLIGIVVWWILHIST